MPDVQIPEFLRSLFVLLVVAAAVGFIGGTLSVLVVILYLAEFQSIAQVATTISALASLLLVIVTAVYVYFTRELVLETQESREQDIAPVISFAVEEATPGIMNVGNGPAAHVEITVSTEPDGESNEYNISSLRPGEFRAYFGEPSLGLFYDDRASENEFETFIVECTCQDGFGNEWSYEWEYDVESIRKEIGGDSGFLTPA